MLCLVFNLKGLSSEISGLNVVSIDRSLLQCVAPRFSAGFVHHLSSERPFKFQRHLIQDFGCNKLISKYCAYLW